MTNRANSKKSSEESLQESENRFRMFFNKTADAMMLLDPIENKFVDCNDSAMTMLNFKEIKESLPLHPAVLSPPTQPDGRDSFEKAQEMIAIALRNGSHRFEWVHRSPYREDFPVEVLLTPLSVEGNQLIMTTWHDITERKQVEQQLKLAANVFTHSHEGILITDADGIIIDVNDTFIEMMGYKREEILGKTPRIFQSGRQSHEFYTDMKKSILEKGFWRGEIWNRRKNGEVLAEIESISTIRDENDVIIYYVAICSDNTHFKEHQKQLERIAHFDLLTDLPNRSLLNDRLSQAMLQCKRQDRLIAVAFLDLDGFKEVNDTYGHNIGDEILIAISRRIKKALRDGDTLARIGGDEFIAILGDLDEVEVCESVLERLLLAASTPVILDKKSIKVSASIGVTFYPTDDVDADLLIRHADQAMYIAKESGKDRYHIFDLTHDDAVKTKRRSLLAIRDALDNEQFVLHYQPQVNMKVGSVIGVEALIRWQHPEKGLLPPSEFLPIIEDHTLCVEMGDWVIDMALTQIANWHNVGIYQSVSVNIAAVQFEQEDFVDKLKAILAVHPNVDPHYLVLEVLETNAIEDIKYISGVMEKCIALGVTFALDDFGTGYSSLTYLRRLPANSIKIDQSFVRDMLEDPEDLAIIEGVISLAKAFKRDVIAEGVETIEHGSALLKLGCELAQGYGIARPMPAADIPAWINEWKPNKAWSD